MILDRLENAARYQGLCDGVDQVLKAVESIKKENFPKERIVLEGGKHFLNPANYKTQPIDNLLFEAHRKYIDVMCMIDGEEIIYVKNTNELENITQEYKEENDAVLATVDPHCTAVRLKAGYFCILFPQDAHAPGCQTEVPGTVQKIIGKVLL